ncbi:MAG TPA: DUF3341 domain-containing protein [Polyangia bacterium]|jgi:hypothetical protein
MRRGLVAEFPDAERLCAAVRALRDAGYVDVDAFAPRPIEELDDLLALPRPRLNWIAFAIGMSAAALGFAVQWFCNAWSYPLNSGGRPPFAIPAFIPITFESGVLLASFSSFFGVFAACGLPRLHHPLFDVDGFERASHDRYFVAVGAGDPRFDVDVTRADLQRTDPLQVAPFGGVA